MKRHRHVESPSQISQGTLPLASESEDTLPQVSAAAAYPRGRGGTGPCRGDAGRNVIGETLAIASRSSLRRRRSFLWLINVAEHNRPISIRINPCTSPLAPTMPAFAIKNYPRRHLSAQGHAVRDFGTVLDPTGDYPSSSGRWPKRSPVASSSGASCSAAPAMARRSSPIASPASAAACAGASNPLAWHVRTTTQMCFRWANE